MIVNFGKMHRNSRQWVNTIGSYARLALNAVANSKYRRWINYSSPARGEFGKSFRWCSNNFSVSFNAASALTSTRSASSDSSMASSKSSFTCIPSARAAKLIVFSLRWDVSAAPPLSNARIASALPAENLNRGTINGVSCGWKFTGICFMSATFHLMFGKFYQIWRVNYVVHDKLRIAVTHLLHPHFSALWVLLTKVLLLFQQLALRPPPSQRAIALLIVEQLERKIFRGKEQRQSKKIPVRLRTTAMH